jgi:alkanesulfonate monooxygenase SsuD/methylene tetrahydromethanopterin reductase-like flavin-dependent oxidoreductase (luciferase family)
MHRTKPSMPRLTFGIALDFGSQLRPLDAQLERQSALLKAAEAAGFEIVAAGESAAPGSFHLPNALLVLAALAQRTRLRLCTGIALLPAWPVTKLALDAAELDQLSGGRLILGVGLGSPPLQSRGGWPADAIGQTADETLEALRRLWSGATEYAGTYISANGALPVLPVNNPGVPIWVGGAIRRSAYRAARLGDGWYGGVNFRLSRLPSQTQAYRDALGGGNGAVAVNRVALVAENERELQDLVQRHLASTLQAYGQPGESLEQATDEVGLVGTPSHVSTLLERYAAAGVTHVFARLSMDDTPAAVARRTIELFGREVIPLFAT